MQPKPSEYTTSAYELRSLFKGSILSYLVGFYIFAFYLELHHRISILQTIRFQFTYGAIVGGLCLYKFINTTQRQASFNTVTKTTFIMIFIMGIYTIFSMDRPESIDVFSDRVLKFALVSFFIYAGTSKVEDLRVILAFMLLAWLKIGQEGFTGWYTGNLVWENQGIPRLHGSTSMYGHPNSFSGFAIGCLPFCAFLLLSLKSNILRLGVLLVLACSLIIIVTTGSRTGYVAATLGTAYFLMQFKSHKIKIMLAAMLICSVSLVIVPDSYKERFTSIFTGQEKEGASSEKRKEIIADAIELYLTYPMGVGVQAFPKVRGEMFGRRQNTHNLYLEVLTNIGPIGFIVFITFVIKLIQLNNLNIKRLHSTDGFEKIDNTLLLNLSKAITGFILLRLVLGLFGMDLYEIYWWIALGLSLAISKLIYVQNKIIKPNNTEKHL
jgi:putative inorganic carbon (hco3(-)) transporter